MDFDDGLYSEGGALLLIFIGIYIAIGWNLGRLLVHFGHQTLGRRLQSITMYTVVFAGGFGFIAIIPAVLLRNLWPQFGWLWEHVAQTMRVGNFLGWCYGVYVGWRRPNT